MAISDKYIIGELASIALFGTKLAWLTYSQIIKGLPCLAPSGEPDFFTKGGGCRPTAEGWT